ncbi:MAG: 50S ribosomal protein L34e [archaeon]
MPTQNQRFKKHKTVTTPSGKRRRLILKKKTQKHTCAICSSVLHGMPHGLRPFEVKKLKKTERRPENPLASILCNDCRSKVYLDAVELKYKLKTKDDIEHKLRKYVDMVINKVQ